MNLSDDAIRAIRQMTQYGLGITTTFVDDGCRLAIALAQRAVLAGLAIDATPDTLLLLTEAAEKNREGHEAVLGFKIERVDHGSQGFEGELLAEIDRLRSALDRIARFGNEPHLGNSDGNMIARQALGI